MLEERPLCVRKDVVRERRRDAAGDGVKESVIVNGGPGGGCAGVGACSAGKEGGWRGKGWRESAKGGEGCMCVTGGKQSRVIEGEDLCDTGEEDFWRGGEAGDKEGDFGGWMNGNRRRKGRRR